MTPEQSQELKALHEVVTGAKQRLGDAWRRAARMDVSDYEFQTLDGPVRLSQLFGGKSELIVVHNMGRKCVYCTMWADGLNGLTGHLRSRAGFALSSPDDAATQAAFAQGRGWRFRMVSTRGTTFARDMGFEHDDKPWPGYSAFHKRGDGSIVRTGAARFGPGDDYCGIWPMMDMLEGGSAGWAPKYEY